MDFLFIPSYNGYLQGRNMNADKLAFATSNEMIRRGVSHV
jgi:hypothetical protein